MLFASCRKTIWTFNSSLKMYGAAITVTFIFWNGGWFLINKLCYRSIVLIILDFLCSSSSFASCNTTLDIGHLPTHSIGFGSAPCFSSTDQQSLFWRLPIGPVLVLPHPFSLSLIYVINLLFFVLRYGSQNSILA